MKKLVIIGLAIVAFFWGFNFAKEITTTVREYENYGVLYDDNDEIIEAYIFHDKVRVDRDGSVIEIMESDRETIKHDDPRFGFVVLEVLS